MNALKQRWHVWALRIDALSFRERVLVFVAVAGVALSLLFVGLIEPALKKQEQMLQIISGLQQDIFGLREQLDNNLRLSQNGHDSELTSLRDEAAAIERDVQARERGLVPPARMVAALKAMLAEQPGLTLVSLETAPVRPALGTPENASTETDAPAQPAGETLYAHGIVLRVAGSYANLTDYLARLERMPWTVQWEAVQVDAHRHPQLEMTLTLHTLSREPTWARL